MEIKDLRNEIDSIDSQLVSLLEKRMQTATEIAEYKKENKVPIFDSGREREVINRVTAEAAPQLSGYVKTLYQTIFDVSRSYQYSLIGKKSSLCQKIDRVVEETPKNRPDRAVIACQGIEGAYSQHACEKMFTYPSIMYFNSFEDVFKAVESGLCRYGVLPVENSTAGSVNRVYDLLGKHKFYITHSLRLCVEHTLLAKDGAELGNIKEVYSHEQAITQCADFLNKAGIKAVACKNTAQAAELVAKSDRSDIAAIGSRDCAKLYGLKMLSADIQNTRNNYTRFICVSKEPEIYPGAKKTGIMLTLPHKPGSLYSIIARFAALGVNLTKLESRPLAGSDFEFLFYFDVEASVYSDELRQLISELENECESFYYLGTYTEA